MMDMVQIQQSFPFNKYIFNFKDLIRLNTIREPLLILCCCCYCFNYQFLNQKLQTVGLTKSQGLGMQEQIQGTDELQMWTGFTGFNRLSRVCQVTEACVPVCAHARAHAHTSVSLWIVLFVFSFFKHCWPQPEQIRVHMKSHCIQQLKIKTHNKLSCFTVYHLEKNDLHNKQSLITTTCF